MNKKTIFFSISVLAILPVAVHAVTPRQSISDTLRLDELVVNAARTETKLRELPVSVSLFNTQQVEMLGAQTLNEMTALAPNFYMADYGSKLTSPIYIRGIGSRINSPSVGMYVDNVPYFEKSAFSFDFFDIYRIELLRGPQGTQYGRNTMGGLINIVTKSPDIYQGTDLTLQAGSYGTYWLGASHYAKPSDAFAYSLSINYRHQDGFFNNEFLNKKVDLLDSYGFRNRLIFKANERLGFENILSFERSNQGGYPYAVFDAATQKMNPVSYNQESGYDRDLLSDALVIKYDGGKYELRSVSSYQYLNDKQYVDQDFIKDSIYFVVQKQKQHTFSQEFTVRSKGVKPYNWLFGLSGFTQLFDTETNLDTYTSKLKSDKQYDHVIAGGALFHESLIRNFFLKNLNLTAGIRIDTEKDKLGYIYNLSTKGVGKLITDTVYPALKGTEILPKVALNYVFGNTNIYSTVTRGYKTGGFNSTFERPEDLTFKPEYSWNYELGAKAILLNNKLFVEGSLFYIDWKDQQIYQTVPSGKGSMLKNAGHTVSKGFEFSAKALPFADVEITLNYGYTYATFISNTLNKTTDYSGNFIPYIPRNTVAAQLQKTFRISKPDFFEKIILAVSYKGTGEIYWNEANSLKQDFYGLLDGRISFVRKNIKFDIWGSNLTETEYNVFYFEALGRKYLQPGKPLQMGVKLAVNF